MTAVVFIVSVHYASTWTWSILCELSGRQSTALIQECFVLSELRYKRFSKTWKILLQVNGLIVTGVEGKQ